MLVPESFLLSSPGRNERVVPSECWEGTDRRPSPNDYY